MTVKGKLFNGALICIEVFNTSEKIQIPRNLQKECKMPSDQLEFDVLFKDCHSRHFTLEKKKGCIKTEF